jgi:hypothetical protein
MLAYVFWHRPRPGTVAADYEDGLRTFHARLTVPSGSFRLGALPFADGEAGYEDWYLVEGWAELGELNAAAVSGARRPPHDAVARLAGVGWAGIYLLVRGEARPPSSTHWVSKPAEESYESFLAATPAPTVWQRQMTLGPAPEFCLVDDAGDPPVAGPASRTLVYLALDTGA